MHFFRFDLFLSFFETSSAFEPNDQDCKYQLLLLILVEVLISNLSHQLLVRVQVDQLLVLFHTLLKRIMVVLQVYSFGYHVSYLNIQYITIATKINSIAIMTLTDHTTV